MEIATWPKELASFTSFVITIPDIMRISSRPPNTTGADN